MNDQKLRNFINGRWHYASTDDYLGVVAAITPFNFPLMIPLWFLP